MNDAHENLLASDPQIAVDDRMLNGPHGPLRVRVYTPGTQRCPGLVWVHGGSFLAGDLDMPEADWVARQFAARGIAVVSVDYCLAPARGAWALATGAPPHEGATYPVASLEVGFAFAWASGSVIAAGPWAIGGASAGGNLAAGAALRLLHGDGPLPALIVLAYPTLHAVQETPDPALRALLDASPDADMFGPAEVLAMYGNYLGGPVEEAEVYAIPGNATPKQLAGFPPTIMINDEVDELRVSGEAFARTLASAGAEIDVMTEPGETHGHLNRAQASAVTSIERFSESILALARKPPTPGSESPDSLNRVGKTLRTTAETAH